MKRHQGWLDIRLWLLVMPLGVSMILGCALFLLALHGGDVSAAPESLVMGAAPVVVFANPIRAEAAMDADPKAFRELLENLLPQHHVDQIEAALDPCCIVKLQEVRLARKVVKRGGYADSHVIVVNIDAEIEVLEDEIEAAEMPE